MKTLSVFLCLVILLPTPNLQAEDVVAKPCTKAYFKGPTNFGAATSLTVECTDIYPNWTGAYTAMEEMKSNPKAAEFIEEHVYYSRLGTLGLLGGIASSMVYSKLVTSPDGWVNFGLIFGGIMTYFYGKYKAEYYLHKAVNTYNGVDQFECKQQKKEASAFMIPIFVNTF